MCIKFKSSPINNFILIGLGHRAAIGAEHELIEIQIVEAVFQVEPLTHIAHTLHAYAIQIPEFMETDLFLQLERAGLDQRQLLHFPSRICFVYWSGEIVIIFFHKSNYCMGSYTKTDLFEIFDEIFNFQTLFTTF